MGDEVETDILIANSVFPDAAALFDALYRPLSQVVDECDFVLDTNVLLTPYTTGKGSLEQLRTVYSRLRDDGRLFVPGQVAREYTRWRARRLTDLYTQLADRRSQAIVPKTELLPVFEGVTAYEALNEAENALKDAVQNYRKCIDQVLADIRGWSLQDPVTKLYNEALGGAAVRDPTFEPAELRKDLEWRYHHKIPPGYKDSGKLDEGVGDLLIWRTILDIGRERRRDLVFVTGEEKADWQHRADNRGLFPRLELVDEYRRASDGRTFHIVALSTLLELFKADSAVVEEVRTQEEAARSRAVVIVHCPFCGSEVDCYIQPAPGASASPRCPDCHQWFHAHWREGETPIVRRPHQSLRSSESRAEVNVDCPYCNAAVVVWTESLPDPVLYPAVTNAAALFTFIDIPMDPWSHMCPVGSFPSRFRTDHSKHILPLKVITRDLRHNIG